MEALTLNQILCLAVAVNNKRKTKKKVKEYWIHPLNVDRVTEGLFHKTYPKIRFFPDEFSEYYKMSVNSFDELKYLLRDKIQKKTVIREPIGVEERLTVTLCFLATGLNFSAMSQNFRIAKQTIRSIVVETCDAIWETLQPREMALPSADEWKNISRQFQQKAQFPNCVGAIDGKHIRLSCATDSVSKRHKSIVLLAVVDAEYRFITINVESYGKEMASTLLRESAFGKMLFNNQLNLPEPEKLPNTETNEALPFVFTGDEAFALHEHILRPYPKRNLSMQKRVFNYRISRAKRYAECAFGILTNKWRVFHSTMLLQPNFAVKVTKAACVLHNFVRVRDGFNDEDTFSYSFGHVNDDDLDFGRHSYVQNAVAIRDKFAKYFVTPDGEVSWQYKQADVST